MLRPALGWSTWNTFRCDVNETLVLQAAKALVTSGLRDLGYRYVNIDDCWMAKERDPSGAWLVDVVKFPSGMRALADQLHVLGLKLGLYSSAGATTCGGFAGSYGHEDGDAALLAEWGADLLKYDFCGSRPRGETAKNAYARMARAVAKTRRPMVYFVCSWGQGEPWNFTSYLGSVMRSGQRKHPDGSPLAAPAWRTGTDLWAVFDSKQKCERSIPKVYNSIMSIADCYGDAMACARGGSLRNEIPGTPDPDMLVAGMKTMTVDNAAGVVGKQGVYEGLNNAESLTHLRLWAMWSAPLIISVDIRRPENTKPYLSQELVRVDQNGDPGLRIRQTNISPDGDVVNRKSECYTPVSIDVWRKQIYVSHPRIEFVWLFVNRATFAVSPTFLFGDLPPELRQVGPGRAVVFLELDSEKVHQEKEKHDYLNDAHARLLRHGSMSLPILQAHASLWISAYIV